MVLGTNPCFFENFGGSDYKFLKYFFGGENLFSFCYVTLLCLQNVCG